MSQEPVCSFHERTAAALPGFTKSRHKHTTRQLSALRWLRALLQAESPGRLATATLCDPRNSASSRPEAAAQDPRALVEFLASDRQKNYRVYELCVAYEFDMHMWETLPPAAFAVCPRPMRRFLLAGGKPRDRGVDCAGFDEAAGVFTGFAQAKWYAPGSTVGWHSVSSFNSLAEALRASHTPPLTPAAAPALLVMPPGVRRHQCAAPLLLEDRELPEARVAEICGLALALTPAEHAGRVPTAEDAAAYASTGVLAKMKASLAPHEGLGGEQENTAAGLGGEKAAHCPPEKSLEHGDDLPLRTCQEEAIAALLPKLMRAAEEGGPPTPEKALRCSMACGTGKTRTVLELIRRFDRVPPHLRLRRPEPAVIFVPSLALL